MSEVHNSLSDKTCPRYSEQSPHAFRTSWSRREHYPNYSEDKGNFCLLSTDVFVITVSLDCYVSTLKMSLDKDGGLLLQLQIGLGNLALFLVYGGDYEMDDRETFSMQGQCQAYASFPPSLPAFIWKIQCKPALGKKPSHMRVAACTLSSTGCGLWMVEMDKHQVRLQENVQYVWTSCVCSWSG